MENLSENRSFRAPVAVLDTVAEQLADVDLTLPDYCPDIEKILKCTLIPKIQTKTLSGGQLQVDGSCVVSVLYVESSRKTIRCCEQSVDFSQRFSVRDTPESFVILTRTKPEYINCRALSPRRLVMHGAFSLYVQVLSTATTTLYTPPEGLEALKRTVGCAGLSACCQEQFTVSEEINVADKPAIEAVLYSKVNASLTDVKAVTGKLMVSGELSLRLFYLTDVESGETARLEYILPFSQIVDCKGVDENTQNLLGCEVMSCDLRLKNDLMSDKPAVALDVKLCLTEEGYVTRDEEIVTDVYSTSFATVPSFESLTVTDAVMPVAENFMEKLNVRVDNGKIGKILDIYADSVTLETSPGEKGLAVCGKINLCMLALDEKNMPVFVERTFDYRHNLTGTEGFDSLTFGKASPGGISYRLADDNTAELRMELKISGGALSRETLRAVSDVQLLEDSPVSRDNCALTLYFADPGENLWQIAKSHNTQLGLLLAENGLTALTTDRPQMLLIPKL